MKKVWENRYSNRPDADFEICETLYSTYKNTAVRHLQDWAIYIEVSGKGYTHGELLNLIDNASSGFYNMGVRQGSKVGIMLNGSIEDAVSLLALNKIGAISKFIDFMNSVPTIKRSVEESNLEILVVDECFLPLEKVVNTNGIPVVVANAKQDYSEGRYTSYDTIMKPCSMCTTRTVPFSRFRPSVIISSSGTTGEPKPIVHSDFSVNAAAQKILYTDFPISSGNVLIKMIPSHIGLGLIISLYTGLLSGVTVVMLSGSSTVELTEKLISFTRRFPSFVKNNGLSPDARLNIITAPIFARALIRSDVIEDLSFIGSIQAGGSKMQKAELDDLLAISASKGFSLPVCNGYGQNELAGPVSVNCNGFNVNGSAGFPTKNTDILIVDPVSYAPLGLNEIGLILESSNSEFLYYDGLDEKTRDSRITLPDGSRWYNSRDLGYMDEEGFLYITGRTTRVAIIEDHKISLDEVEQKLRNFPFIQDCATIVPETGGSTEIIVAYIVTDVDDVLNLIKSEGTLYGYEIPSEIIKVMELPLLSNGKIDYQRLKNMYDTRKDI